MRNTFTLAIGLLLAVQAPVAGQQDSTGGLCYRARPAPACRAFVLTDAGVHFRITRTSGHSAVSPIIDWGVMVNADSHDAIGADWFVLLEDEDFATGPRVRYRRWLGRDRSLDVAVGMAAAGGSAAVRAGTIVGLVQYRPVHWIGVGVRPELVRHTDFNCGPLTCVPATTHTARLSVGAEVGWVPGLTLSVVGGALVGLVAMLVRGID